tara:strand:- start:1811 stop:2629 length:819 start_codon:yes stop_codon:yes gene_type:complete
MALLNKYHLATVRPVIDTLPNVQFTADDVLFDWTAFEVPRGGCALRSISAIIPGTDATATNGGLQMDLYFATTFNGTAPTTLGNTNAAMNVISATANKNHITHMVSLLGSEMEDAGDGMVGFNVLGKGAVTSATTSGPTGLVILQGDTEYTGTTKGYQTIWVAGVAQGTYNFGTNCLLDGAITSGSAGAQTLDVSEDADADDLFAIGDELLAAANDGSSVQTIGTVTALTADTITVDAKDINGTNVWSSGALADDDEICYRRPITLRLGLEY